MMGVLLLATALGLGAGTEPTAAPRPAAERWFRAVATAGPTLVRDRDGGRGTALGFGTGFEMGTNPWVRFTGRWEVHLSRSGSIADQTTVVFAGVKLQYRPAGRPVWPYGFVGAGYGAREWPPLEPPLAKEAGLGGQVELPGGQEVFLEVAVLGVRDRRLTPIRFGVLLP